MEIILPENKIEFRIGSKFFEGNFKGTHENNILVEIKNQKLKVPFNKISSLEKRKEKTPAKEIKEFKQICEGEIIPNATQTIKLTDTNTTELFRLLIRLGNPDTDLPEDYATGYTSSLMTFHNPTEYERVKNYLDKWGYTYKYVGDPNAYARSEPNHKPQTVSPYPKNVHEN